LKELDYVYKNPDIKDIFELGFSYRKSIDNIHKLLFWGYFKLDKSRTRISWVKNLKLSQWNALDNYIHPLWYKMKSLEISGLGWYDFRWIHDRAQFKNLESLFIDFDGFFINPLKGDIKNIPPFFNRQLKLPKLKNVGFSNVQVDLSKIVKSFLLKYPKLSCFSFYNYRDRDTVKLKLLFEHGSYKCPYPYPYVGPGPTIYGASGKVLKMYRFERHKSCIKFRKIISIINS